MRRWCLVLAIVAGGCSSEPMQVLDADTQVQTFDGGRSAPDAGDDAGAGPVATAGDAGPTDGEPGSDLHTGTADVGTSDVGTADAGTADVGTADAGTADAGAMGGPLMLSVMSFNIRFGSAFDGLDSWIFRRNRVVDVLRGDSGTARAPEWDVVGLQEALASQLTFIEGALSGYGRIGVGRDDGVAAGEFSAILYRRDRFDVAASGTFWFSDTPMVTASTSWGNSIPRICTWARLVDRSSGRGFHIFNVHLDHRSQNSRARSVELLAERIAERTPPDGPVIVTGDFNAGESSSPIRFLTGTAVRASADDGSGYVPPASPSLTNAFRVVNPNEQVVGTFNGFQGRMNGDMIDYVLFSSDPIAAVDAAEIDRRETDGRTPSDHYPVTARLGLP